MSLDSSLRKPPITVLCLGDLHLGRVPSKAPLSQAELELCLPGAALKRACDYAISTNVNLVVLTGDLADQSNALFEAYDVLSRQMQRLLAAEIPVYAIAGNHDYDVLPKLAEELPGFTLLGAKGSWEEVLLDIKTKSSAESSSPKTSSPKASSLESSLPGRKLRIQGVSFTARHWNGNPLEQYQTPTDNIPTLALLHCDVDATGSAFAPVRAADLKQHSAVSWLLGHIHVPRIISEEPLVLYPGSPQGLDPGESASHGAFLVTIDELGSTDARALPLAALRYEELAIDISHAESLTEVRSQILSALRAWRTKDDSNHEHLRYVSFRLAIQGQTSLRQDSLLSLKQELLENPGIEDTGLRYLIEQVRLEAKPRVDLASLAQRDDPPSLLARRIQILQDKEPRTEYDSMIAEAKRRIEIVSQDANYQFLERKALTEDVARERLLSSAWTLLGELLEQGRAIDGNVAAQESNRGVSQ